MIYIENLTCFYPKTKNGLKNINLLIQNGEFIYLTGRTGSGKTTLLKTLSKEMPVQKGSINIDGIDIVQLPKKKRHIFKRQIGVVYQDFRLLEYKTVLENLMYVADVLKLEQDEALKNAKEALRLVGLEDKENTFPSSLSGGEKQRVAIARAIMNGPRVLFADEPTGNLDNDTAKEIFEIFNEIHEQCKTTIIFATHNTQLIKQYPQRTVTLDNGTIINDTANENVSVNN